MIYICEQCKKEFKAPPCQKARFCDRSCYDKSREGLFKCSNCNKQFKYFRSHKKGKLIFCSGKCQRQMMVGKNHPRWSGGETVDGKGYKIIYMPYHPQARNNKVLEHRFVMEQKIGRLLNSDEIVHHINHDKLDNRPENLVIVARDEHPKIHDTREGGWSRNYKECIVCGTTSKKHYGRGHCFTCYNRESPQHKKV